MVAFLTCSVDDYSVTGTFDGRNVWSYHSLGSGERNMRLQKRVEYYAVGIEVRGTCFCHHVPSWQNGVSEVLNEGMASN